MAVFHGIRIVEVADGIRTLALPATSIIGLVATGPAADADLFPLNTAVRITDLSAAIAKAGATGTLAGALQAIADQARAIVVVVRVAPGADAAATTAAVIGGEVDGKKTGMQALLAAQAQLGIKPRIIGAPGLDTAGVTAALAVVAQKLRGYVYASAIGTTVAAAVTYRATYSARELTLIFPDFLSVDSTGATVTSYAVARAMGLRARIDQEVGFHKTISNVEVQGVVGLTKDIQWDLQSTATEAGTLNDAQITALVNTGAGYRFWGNRNTSVANGKYPFETSTRTAQVMLDTMSEGMLPYIDQPLVPSLAKHIVGTIDQTLRAMTRAGYILGGRAYFNPDKNPASELGAGRLAIDYEYGEVPPLEGLGLTQRITDTYLADFSTGVLG